MKYVALISMVFQLSAHADVLQAPKGYEYAIVTVLPANAELKPEQRALVNQAQSAIQAGLPAVAQSISSILLSAQASTKSVLLESTQQLKSEVLKKIAGLSKHLPSDPLFVNAYIVAWPSNKIPKSAERLGPGLAFIPLTTSSKAEAAAAYAQINDGVHAALATQYGNGNRFQFAGAALRIMLDKNISMLSLQFFGGLNPGVSPFDNKSEEVELSQISIPPAEKIGHRVPYAASVLLTVRQRLDQETPTMNLDFGTFGDIAGTAATAGGFSAYGEFQIFRNPISTDEGADCNLKTATPTLIGVLGPRALGIQVLDDIAKGRHVKFRIFELDIDPVTGHIVKMDVRMDLGILQCLSRESIKLKFKDRADDALQNLIKSFYNQDDLTDKLMDQLYKNP